MDGRGTCGSANYHHRQCGQCQYTNRRGNGGSSWIRLDGLQNITQASYVLGPAGVAQLEGLAADEVGQVGRELSRRGQDGSADEDGDEAYASAQGTAELQ